MAYHVLQSHCLMVGLLSLAFNNISGDQKLAIKILEGIYQFALSINLSFLARDRSRKSCTKPISFLMETVSQSRRLICQIVLQKSKLHSNANTRFRMYLPEQNTLPPSASIRILNFWSILILFPPQNSVDSTFVYHFVANVC